MAWSEKRLLRWLERRAPRPASVVAGTRVHDAIVLKPSAARQVVCTDQTIEGVHFAPGEPPRAVGRKAVGRVLSDLAATAARPRGVLLALSAPARTEEPWLRAVIQAVDRTARRHDAELLGGDLACAPGPLSLAVTAVGELAGRRRPPGRDRARPGQRVVLTGAVGGSPLGRHLEIVPRLEAGRILYACGATAMIDVSDGFALDVSRVARASGVRIDVEHVPVHKDAVRLAKQGGGDPRDHALNDGEDHELVATLPNAALPRALARARQVGVTLHVVGRVRTGRGLWLEQSAGGGLVRWREEGGWTHGG